MVVYPFDPQCRLESNWIPKETLSAFPSNATRTMVPLHAPFYAKNCKVFKGNNELILGKDYEFSIEHKVASHRTGFRIYGGITIIRDELIPPFTVAYHPQGGTFEATASQIKTYLDKKLDIWESSWEALINSDYYPAVKILYDIEAFSSEPDVIKAIGSLETAVKSKDESTEIRFALFKTRIDNLRKDVERLRLDEHIAKTRNAHGTKAHHVGALSKEGIAANSKRIGGLNESEFMNRLFAEIPPIKDQFTDKFKQGEDLKTDTKLVIDDGVLTFGDSVTIEMDDEHFSQLGDNGLALVADADAKTPGTVLQVLAGGNELTITSTGSVQDNRKLKVNEEEIITENTLKQFAYAIINKDEESISTTKTASIEFIGEGSIDSPIEVVTSIPVSAGDAAGTVKVVHEGSHGYPCPGYSNRNFYVFHAGNNKYIGLRNGADDLESDVFITDITVDPLAVKPTAERFRPRNLPSTAIPTNVRHGTEDVVWLDTTDGVFLLITNRNPDYHAWKAVKVLNSDMNLGYYGTPFIHAGKIYVLCPQHSGGSSTVRLWEAAIPSGNTVTMSARTLSGTNCNGTAQNAATFNHFDKMYGNKGEKCYAYSDDGYYDYLSISHAGDQFDYVQAGGQVRICHIANHYTSTKVKAYTQRIHFSYLVDLTTGRVIEDAPGNYPLKIRENDIDVKVPRDYLATSNGNWTSNAKRANGRTFVYATYDRLSQPTIYHLENTGSLSELDNIKWNAHYWRRKAEASYLGLYGTKVHSGLRGATVFGKNRIMAVCMDNTSVDFRYDPYGSYSPTLQGYGPTNDRVSLDYATQKKLKRIVWVSEESGYVGRGCILSANRLTEDSTYEGGHFSNPISITEAMYMSVKTQAVNRFYDAANGPIVDSTLTLMIHRSPGVPQIGYVQVVQEKPNSGGQKVCRYYVFYITTDRSVGNVSVITVGGLITSDIHNDAAKDLEQNSDRLWNTTALIHKLEDGGVVIGLSGARLAHIGNTTTVAVGIVRNAAGTIAAVYKNVSDTSIGAALMGTRELGFGYTQISNSGEGLYLMSFGRTTADVVKNIASGTTTRYVLALSRSDAGDNVVVSQLAAYNTKAKVESLLTPRRLVQGMDLSQDRVITKAMLANSNDIPNVSDVSYPTQQKHLDSLRRNALATHTHPASDFTMAPATEESAGAAKVAPTTGNEEDAVSVASIAEAVTLHGQLIARNTVLDKLDPSITVNYEV